MDSEEDGQPEVVLFIVDAGGGHRAAATALTDAAARQGRPFRLRVVNAQDVLASFDFMGRLTGRNMEAQYNWLISSQRTGLLVPLLRVYQWLIRRLHGRLVRRVAEELRQRPPALAVSLFPNMNAVFRDAVREACPGRSCWVVLTDLADFPPHFWMETGLDRVVVGSGRAAEQARALGLPPERIRHASGMILHPRFYPRAGAAERARARTELSLPADVFVVMMLFGGKGSSQMRPLSQALLQAVPAGHVVAICGDNPPLYESLAEIEAGAGGRLHRVGFTRRVADYLAAADLLVTKPGPASIMEAFHQGVPVVVTCNRATIPQERFNADWIAERGLGLVVSGWQEMAPAVAALAADPPRLAQLRANVAALPENRAVFEVLDLIQEEVAGPVASAR
jgi:1,2-diacylglycerol 3-beta-galactosyltransferase